MKCPNCEVRMIEIERLGAKALLCPECSGEWLPPAPRHRAGGRPHDTPRRRHPVHARDAGVAAAGRRDDLFDWF